MGGPSPSSREVAMNYALSALVYTLSLSLGMLLLLEVGRRIGLRRRAKAAEGAVAGSGVIEGAVFALLGLLVAFTFSGAAARFDTRRQLIVEETNAIGTAYLRLDLLPAAAQQTLRERFRQYLAVRLEGYHKLSDVAAVQEALARSVQLQGGIWTQAVAGSRRQDAHPDAAKLLLPALNAMIDMTTTRILVACIHLPTTIVAMLFGLALACALLAGHGMVDGTARSWPHIVSFVAIIAAAVYVILDLEFPRLGLLQVKAFDQALEALLQSMK
jgi:hypothetical protein